MPIRPAIRPPLLYWFPAVATVAGIADEPTRVRLQAAELVTARQNRGPASGEGLFAARRPADIVGFAPSRQTWHELRVGLWLGVESDWKPEQFLRETPLDGLWATIGSKQWLLPQANPELDACSLPLVPWFEAGVLIPRAKREHASLAARATHFHRRIRQAMLDGALGLSEDPLLVYRFIADGIGVNYDLSLDELLALEILDPASVTNAIHALTGWRLTLARCAERLQPPEAARGEQ